MDSPSAQLARELRAAVAREVSSRRPILHRLNNDTSYLLQLPRAAAAARQSGSRIFYNVLIDPWLAGGQSDTASWISQQWHSAKSAVESVKEVDRLAREIEALASNCDSGDEEDWVVADVLKNNNGAFTTGTYMPHEMVDEDETALDAVIISHEFTDHCHKRTLLSIHPDVPVFAPEVAAALMMTWTHFRTVCTIPVCSRSLHPFDWRSVSIPPLPEWFGLARVEVPDDPLAYHAALVLMFDTSLFEPWTPANVQSDRKVHTADDDSPAHVIIYTPHGTPAAVVTEHVISASPSLKPLALLHGLHEICAHDHVLQLGGLNAKQIQDKLQADYWVATHDEIKTGVGAIMSKFSTRRKIWITDQLLKHCESEEDFKKKNLNFNKLTNGQSIILA